MKKHQPNATVTLAAVCSAALFATGASMLVAGKGVPHPRDVEQDMERFARALNLTPHDTVPVLVYLRTRIHNWVAEGRSPHGLTGSGGSSERKVTLMLDYIGDWIDAIPEVFFALDEAVAEGAPTVVQLPARPACLAAAAPDTEADHTAADAGTPATVVFAADVATTAMPTIAPTAAPTETHARPERMAAAACTDGQKKAICRVMAGGKKPQDRAAGRRSNRLGSFSRRAARGLRASHKLPSGSGLAKGHMTRVDGLGGE